MNKIIVKAISYDLHADSGSIKFSVKNFERFPGGVIRDLIPKLERMIANELENTHLLSDPEKKEI